MLRMMTFASVAPLPVREIPGSYGLPVVGPLVDRFDYNVTEGPENFFKTRIEKYKSTVLRVNMPPGPPIVSDPRVIMLLDAKSFPTLFDLTKVDKRDVLTGAYMPSTDFTGGYRTTVYLDPSEEKHGKGKKFCFEVLKLSRNRLFPEFGRAFDEAFQQIDKQFDSDGKGSFTDHVDDLIFNFLLRALVGSDPVAPGPASLGTNGPTYVKAWLAPQLAPIASAGGILPRVLEEFTIHSVELPFGLVSGFYQKLYDFVWMRGSALFDIAEKEFGLPRAEACNDLLFNIGFNAFGGMLIFFPAIVQYITKAGADLHRALAEEVRGAVSTHGSLNMGALESMALVRSAVYEVLRMDPPVPLQYGRAKCDFLVESHDARYAVKEGELLGGYQPLATKDPKVFDNAEEFNPRRFLGEGEELLQYVLWSNGRETEETMVDNKQCAGKDVVVMVARLLVAHLFLRYDSFAIDEESSSVIFTSLSKPS
uniref:Allene oxide synthase n=1 Tax=Araucaria cunninghamii TaxID=56994 RepID=A0A0D6R0T5_ARACU